MKKSILLLSGLVMLMTACSNDEVVEKAQNKAIGFDAFVNNSTRATDISTANNNFTSFDVWGVTTDPTNASTGLTSVFVQQPVTNTDGAWSYSPLRYWVVGNAYRFSAIAPSNATGVTVEQDYTNTTISESQGGLTITFNNEAAKANVDLCYAFNKVASATAAQAPVPMNFSHMLSRVKFTFKNTFAAQNSVILVKNVQITDATAAATINKLNGEETWSTPQGTFEIGFATVKNSSMIENTNYIPGIGDDTEAAYVSTAHQYLIPLTAATEYTVTFDVTLYNYNELANEGTGAYEKVRSYSHVIPLPSIAYQNNFSYNFVAEINEETIDPNNVLRPIQFAPVMGEWGKFNDENVEFPEKN